jgi:hypothetical protein
LIAAGVYSPDRVQAVAKCEVRGQGGEGVGEGAEVNLATGEVTDLRTGRVLSSPESGRLARQILQDREAQHSSLDVEVGGECPKE